MKSQLQAITIEMLKQKHLKITWITFVAFSLAPIMGGLFMIILDDPTLSKGSTLAAKAELVSFSKNWKSYFSLLSQSVGVGGVLVFGFVASWIFGREFSDGTAKDLLALPMSRSKIINAKFICYILWCTALAVSNIIIGLAIGIVLGLGSPVTDDLSNSLQHYFITTLLTIPLGTMVAFFALVGKGYLAPLGLVAITLVLAQVVAATGVGFYFPWSIPGLYSGAGGTFVLKLNEWSYTILGLTSIAGYCATILWWKFSDQTK